MSTVSKCRKETFFGKKVSLRTIFYLGRVDTKDIFLQKEGKGRGKNRSVLKYVRIFDMIFNAVYVGKEFSANTP